MRWIRGLFVVVVAGFALVSATLHVRAKALELIAEGRAEDPPSQFDRELAPIRAALPERGRLGWLEDSAGPLAQIRPLIDSHAGAVAARLLDPGSELPADLDPVFVAQLADMVRRNYVGEGSGPEGALTEEEVRSFLSDLVTGTVSAASGSLACYALAPLELVEPEAALPLLCFSPSRSWAQLPAIAGRELLVESAGRWFLFSERR
jgi:hypothetical protein